MSNLQTVRDYFIEFTGRADLGTIGGVDTGANKYINEGQRFLDRLTEFRKTENRIFESMSIGDYYLTFSNCRVLKEVWCNDSEDRWRMTKLDFDVFRQEYPDLVSEIDTGAPSYWTPAKLRSSNYTDRTSLGTFLDYVADSMENTQGILYGPPNDEAVVLEIYGKFYSPWLTDENDTSFWAAQHPMTLARAAAYQVEAGYRNREGMTDWLSSIQTDIAEIDKDFAEEESVNELEG